MWDKCFYMGIRAAVLFTKGLHCMHWHARLVCSVVLELTLLMTQTTVSQVPFQVPLARSKSGQRGHTLADLVRAQRPAWASKKLRWRQGRPTPGAAGPAPDFRHQPPGSTHFCNQKEGVGYTRYVYRMSILIRVYPIDMT